MKARVQCNWPTRRLRFLVRRSLTDGQRQALAQASQVSFLPMEAIGEQGKLDLSGIRDTDQVSTGYTLFFEGDVVVAKITPCFENGKGALVKGLTNGVGFGTTELHVLSPGPELNARFLYYVTASHSFRKLGEAGMTGAAGQKRVPEDFVRDYPILCPPLPMQRAIADYLDRETGRLDALVAAKERVLELLVEKRRALITRAITRGLNPNAPLRDSGLPWLGQIPKHWETKRAKWLFTERDERSETGDEELLSLRMELGLVPHNDVSEKTTRSEELIGYKKCSTREIVINRMRASSGLVAIAPQDGLVSPDYAVFKVSEDAYPEYFTLLFKTSLLQTVFRTASKGLGTGSSGFLRLYSEDFLGFWLPAPPKQDQEAIVAHIERETGKLDALRSATERTVALLKERRAALIAAAVTGQLDSADSGKLM